MNENDLREANHFLQNLSTLIRLHGAEHMGRQYVVIRLARMEVTGPLDYSDLQRILGRVIDLRTWYESWHQEALDAEKLAERFEADGRAVSAADLYHRASACHHWGAYLARIGSSQKAEGRLERVRCYREAVRLWDDAIKAIALPYEGLDMPGYLHLAADAPARPCVIMVNGADSVKEEYHNWARQFVRRGLNVMTMDGPGQGEMLGRLPMRPDAWEEPIGAAIDALTASGQVDAERIGIWGSSMGGFLVLRAAAFEPRVRAAISSGGFYDFRDYRYWAVTSQLNVMENLMVDSLSEARDFMDEFCSLEGVVERIAVPYLVIHGARDELVSVEEAERMVEGPKGEFANFEDGFHTCTNYNATLVPLMCDWMARKLSEVP
ncbi:MAG: alpha/beta hydrolase family protein [Acidimicrobiales bacterium]